MECDDLKGMACHFSPKSVPSFPPSQIHIMMWEKRTSVPLQTSGATDTTAARSSVKPVEDCRSVTALNYTIASRASVGSAAGGLTTSCRSFPSTTTVTTRSVIPSIGFASRSTLAVDTVPVADISQSAPNVGSVSVSAVTNIPSLVPAPVISVCSARTAPISQISNKPVLGTHGPLSVKTTTTVPVPSSVIMSSARANSQLVTVTDKNTGVRFTGLLTQSRPTSVVQSSTIKACQSVAGSRVKASQSAMGSSVRASQSVAGSSVRASQSVAGSSVNTSHTVAGGSVRASQSVAASSVKASQSVTGSSVGMCTQDDKALRLQRMKENILQFKQKREAEGIQQCLSAPMGPVSQKVIDVKPPVNQASSTVLAAAPGVQRPANGSQKMTKSISTPSLLRSISKNEFIKDISQPVKGSYLAALQPFLKRQDPVKLPGEDGSSPQDKWESSSKFAGYRPKADRERSAVLPSDDCNARSCVPETLVNESSRQSKNVKFLGTDNIHIVSQGKSGARTVQTVRLSPRKDGRLKRLAGNKRTLSFVEHLKEMKPPNQSTQVAGKKPKLSDVPSDDFKMMPPVSSSNVLTPRTMDRTITDLLKKSPVKSALRQVKPGHPQISLPEGQLSAQSHNHSNSLDKPAPSAAVKRNLTDDIFGNFPSHDDHPQRNVSDADLSVMLNELCQKLDIPEKLAESKTSLAASGTGTLLAGGATVAAHSPAQTRNSTLSGIKTVSSAPNLTLSPYDFNLDDIDLSIFDDVV